VPQQHPLPEQIRRQAAEESIYARPVAYTPRRRRRHAFHVRTPLLNKKNVIGAGAIRHIAPAEMTF
jgi:hypothetical protein